MSSRLLVRETIALDSDDAEDTSISKSTKSVKRYFAGEAMLQKRRRANMLQQATVDDDIIYDEAQAAEPEAAVVPAAPPLVVGRSESLDKLKKRVRHAVKTSLQVAESVVAIRRSVDAQNEAIDVKLHAYESATAKRLAKADAANEPVFRTLAGHSSALIELRASLRDVSNATGTESLRARVDEVDREMQAALAALPDYDALVARLHALEQSNAQLRKDTDRRELDQRDAVLRDEFRKELASLRNEQREREAKLRDELEQHKELARQCENLFNSLQTVQERVDALDDMRAKLDAVVEAHADMRAKLATAAPPTIDYPHTPGDVASNGGGAAAPSSGGRKPTPSLDQQQQSDALPLSVVSYVTREIQLLRQSLEAKMKLASQPLVGTPQRTVIRKLEGQFK